MVVGILGYTFIETSLDCHSDTTDEAALFWKIFKVAKVAISIPAIHPLPKSPHESHSKLNRVH